MFSLQPALADNVLPSSDADGGCGCDVSGTSRPRSLLRPPQMRYPPAAIKLLMLLFLLRDVAVVSACTDLNELLPASSAATKLRMYVMDIKRARRKGREIGLGDSKDRTRA